MASPEFNRAMRTAVADALGFVLGALLGRWIGVQLGFDFFASKSWEAVQIVGLLLILLGAGAGRWLFRRLLLKQP